MEPRQNADVVVAPQQKASAAADLMVVLVASVEGCLLVVYKQLVSEPVRPPKVPQEVGATVLPAVLSSQQCLNALGDIALQLLV